LGYIKNYDEWGTKNKTTVNAGACRNNTKADTAFSSVVSAGHSQNIVLPDGNT
jgi:hypothetical protein